MFFRRAELPDEESRQSLSLLIALVSCGLFATSSGLAQEDSDEEELKPNSIELFLGATLTDEDDNASVGLEYERRLSERFGIGLLTEYTRGPEWAVLLPFSVHITESWKILFAAGAELSTEEGEHQQEFLGRLGVSYEFGFTGWSLAPEVNVDFVDGDTKVVLGVSIGFH